jgi:hypothetical protein
VAAVIAGVIAAGWSPTMLTDWREPLWWTGTAAAIVAILLLAAAIYPRTKRRDGRSRVIAYYGDVVGLTDRTELLIALERSARRDVDRLIDQTYEDRVIKITDLVGDDGLLDGFTFIGCHIKGPAVIWLAGSTLSNNVLATLRTLFCGTFSPVGSGSRER